MGLRFKLASIVLLILAFAIVILSVLSIDRTLKVMVADLGDSGERITGEIFEQMRVALAQSSGNPEQTLANDSGLATLLDSERAFGKAVVYARVVNAEGKPLAGTDPTQVGPSSEATPFERLQRRAESSWPLSLIGPLWSDHHYEISRSVEVNGHLFGTINVGLSTGLVAHEVHRLVGQDITFAALAILLTALIVTALGNRLLRPVLAITSGVEQLAAGADEVKVELDAPDELGTLAEKFNQMSQRVKADRTRWENERGHLFNVFRSITDAVVLVDAERSLLFANSEAERRLSLPEQRKGEGKSLASLIGGDHQIMRMIDAAFNAGTEVRDVAIELRSSNGSPSQRLLVSIFALGQGAKAAGVLVMMRDLEPMQELETVVDYSSRLARLGGLIGGVAHQIRNPLNAMTLQLELLRQDSEKGNDTGSRISRIRHEIARLDQAVDALLRFMRPEQLKLEDVNLNDLLVEAGAQVTRPNIRLEYQLSADLPSARIDSAMISEAIKNIIQNAIQAMPNGGMLTIASRRSPDGMNEAIVADQGVGIAPENLDRIFDLYFTTKQGGTGLGLSLALRAVELHHGFVEINSRPGQGTTVTIRLPSTARFERTRLPSNQPDQVTR